MMDQYWWPISSFVIGVLFIVFREKIAIWIQKIFEAFPNWPDRIKFFHWKDSVRPVFIAILGAAYIIVAILGVIEIATG